MSVVVSTARMGSCFQLAPDEGAAQLFYLLFQGSCSNQIPMVGFSHLSEASFPGGIPPPLGVLLLRGWTSVELGSPDICGASLHSHPWQSSKKDTTSATSSGSLGGDPGSLWSLYTF